MNLYEAIKTRKEKISIIGLGYVGLPIAVAFSRKAEVIGFDYNEEKIELYKSGVDPTKEVGNEGVADCEVDFTADPFRLREAKFHIVAVPTPINDDNTPNLTYLEQASVFLGKNITKGSIAVFESTVYPGVTEDVCVPILEAESGLKYGDDFQVGYSPERINPSDMLHRLENIAKVVSGMNPDTLDTIAKVYELVIEAGVYRAESIKVAEAAKVIENSQRDINIAFMNELSIIFNRMNIDTLSVLEAAGTKWNFLNFRPGLVGGHCIGIDPYYLTYKAELLGYRSQIILSGRRINDSMGKYVVENLIKTLLKADITVKSAKIAILGLTFKENCPDTRNTRVMDIYNELLDYGILASIIDPVADHVTAMNDYGVELVDIGDIKGIDAIIIAVAHDDFKSLSMYDISRMFGDLPDKKRVIFDLKGIFNREECEAAGYYYWRL